jgi:hypothetical protein
VNYVGKRFLIREASGLMLLLALDPGFTTGWAMFRKPNNRDGYTSGQVKGGIVIYDWLMGFIAAEAFDMPMPDLIIYETFKYRQLPKADLTPVEAIGVIKLFAKQYNIPLHDQNPAQAVGEKAFWSDDRLKHLGLYQVGKVHANDAMRHLLYYLGFGPGVQIGEDNIRKLKS